jgi:hypothetical protein
MKYRLIVITIVICSISRTSYSAVLDEEDTISVVNGFVYEDVHTQPLQDFPVYIAELDSSYNLVRLDSVFTDEEGKFTAELTRGFYTVIPWLDGYITLNYYENIELADSLYNIEFRIISPVISLSDDTLIIQSLSDEPVEKSLLVTNQGTGELIYSCALYADYEQPEGLASTVESDWMLIFRDGQDQDSLQHDISELWIRTTDNYIYIKAVFYDTIRSFETFAFEFTMNSDRDTSTGRSSDGHDYDFFIGYHDDQLVAVMLALIDYGWVYVGNASYTSLVAGRNYIIAGYPLDYFDNSDYMFASSLVRHGESDFTYEDIVPDWQFGEDFIISVHSPPAISTNKFYGEVGSSETDTIRLNILPEIAGYNIEECYIALVCNEPGAEVITIPVIIEHATGLKESINPEKALTATFYPNPFNSNVNIECFLSYPAHVKLYICDAGGKPVKMLADEEQLQGSCLFEWDGTDNGGIPVKPGIYISILIADGAMVQQKLVLIK